MNSQRPCRITSTLLLVLTCSWAGLAHGHLLNMSKARIQLLPGGGVQVQLALDLLLTVGSREAYYELSTRDAPLDDPTVGAMLAALPDAVDVRLGGERIALTLGGLEFPREDRGVFLDPLRWPRTDITLHGSVASLQRPPADGGLQIRYGDSFRFEEPIANSIEDVASGRSQTRWLVTGQASPVFDARSWYDDGVRAPEATTVDWPGLGNFLSAGFWHILPGGIDHLLFVAALCLGAASLPSLLGIISVFTIAHSLTLGAMVLGLVSAPSRWVEAMILLSIVWVALANLRRGAIPPSRWLVVLCFGLLHGLGFASALLDIGLPAEQLLLSLVAFNLGVELGQLAFLLAMLVVLLLLNQRGPLAIPRYRALPTSLALRRGASIGIATCALAMML